MKTLSLAGVTLGALIACAGPSRERNGSGTSANEEPRIRGASEPDLRARPRWLVEHMRAGSLRSALERCANRPLLPTRFSIGHRGAPRGFPEHTRESYEAAARMGAGIIECDVTFTRDLALVCRHSQCDLHTTTNILEIPALAAKCSRPFSPADPTTGKDASARCCTSDVTLAEFESLCGKTDGFDPKARTVDEYVRMSPAGSTPACGKVMSHAESIALIDRLGRDFIPELKAPSVPMPFEGTYTFERYAQQLVDEYKAAGIAPERVFAQSANVRDLSYWLSHEPRFGHNAVFLDEGVDAPGGYDAAVDGLPALSALGVRTVAPPMWALLTLDAGQHVVPSRYATVAKRSGLEMLTWTLERSGSLESGGGYYYQSMSPAITMDGDAYVVLDVLAKQVGIRGIFSDWPATVTYYADCMGL